MGDKDRLSVCRVVVVVVVKVGGGGLVALASFVFKSRVDHSVRIMLV